MADYDLVITAQLEGMMRSQLASTSAEIKNLINQLDSISNASKNYRRSQQAVNTALGIGSDGTRVYAKNTMDAARNAAVLENRLKLNERQLKALNSQLKGNAFSKYFQSTTGQLSKQNSHLKQSITHLRNIDNAASRIRFTRAIRDSETLSRNILNVGKNLQYVGRNLTIGLTLPIVQFFRMGLDSFKRLETEIIRFTKIANIERNSEQFVVLSKRLDDVSFKFGVARELVQGVAADFATLGISSTEVIADLVELTAEVEKLGDVDIATSRGFVQSLFFQSLTVQRENVRKGAQAFVDYGLAIDQVRSSLYMFNLVENNTVVTMQMLTKAIPEMQAVTTQFGLSLLEASSMFAPMIAAGMEVGASGNSIKVSLQRLVAPAKQNREILNELAVAIGGFNFEVGVGIDSVAELARSFNALKDQKGLQGALELFARLFGVRQGSRMLQAFTELAFFQEQLGVETSKAFQIANTIVDEVNKSLGDAGFDLQFSAKDIATLGEVARVAGDAYAQGSDELFNAIVNGQTIANEKLAETLGTAGEDYLDLVDSQAGKIILAQAAGSGKAEQVYIDELGKALESPAVKLAQAREMFKSISRQLIPPLVEALEAIMPTIQRFAESFANMSPAFKRIIAGGLILAATFGPIITVFSNLTQLVGSLRLGFFKLIGVLASSTIFGRGGKIISADTLAGINNLDKFGNKLSRISDEAFFFSGSNRKFQKQLRKSIRSGLQEGFADFDPDSIVRNRRTTGRRTSLSGLTDDQAKQEKSIRKLLGFQRLFKKEAKAQAAAQAAGSSVTNAATAAQSKHAIALADAKKELRDLKRSVNAFIVRLKDHRDGVRLLKRQYMDLKKVIISLNSVLNTLKARARDVRDGERTLATQVGKTKEALRRQKDVVIAKSKATKMLTTAIGGLEKAELKLAATVEFTNEQLREQRDLLIAISGMKGPSAAKATSTKGAAVTKTTAKKTAATAPAGAAKSGSTSSGAAKAEADAGNAAATNVNTAETVKSTTAKKANTQASKKSTESKKKAADAEGKATKASKKSTEASKKSTEASKKATESTKKVSKSQSEATKASKKSTEVSKKATESTKKASKSQSEVSKANEEASKVTKEAAKKTRKRSKADLKLDKEIEEAVAVEKKRSGAVRKVKKSIEAQEEAAKEAAAKARLLAQSEGDLFGTIKVDDKTRRGLIAQIDKEISERQAHIRTLGTNADAVKANIGAIEEEVKKSAALVRKKASHVLALDSATKAELENALAGVKQVRQTEDLVNAMKASAASESRKQVMNARHAAATSALSAAESDLEKVVAKTHNGSKKKSDAIAAEKAVILNTIAQKKREIAEIEASIASYKGEKVATSSLAAVQAELSASIRRRIQAENLATAETVQSAKAEDDLQDNLRERRIANAFFGAAGMSGILSRRQKMAGAKPMFNALAQQGAKEILPFDSPSISEGKSARLTLPVLAAMFAQQNRVMPLEVMEAFKGLDLKTDVRGLRRISAAIRDDNFLQTEGKGIVTRSNIFGLDDKGSRRQDRLTKGLIQLITQSGLRPSDSKRRVTSPSAVLTANAVASLAKSSGPVPMIPRDQGGMDRLRNTRSVIRESLDDEVNKLRREFSELSIQSRKMRDGQAIIAKRAIELRREPSMRAFESRAFKQRVQELIDLRKQAGLKDLRPTGAGMLRLETRAASMAERDAREESLRRARAQVISSKKAEDVRKYGGIRDDYKQGEKARGRLFIKAKEIAKVEANREVVARRFDDLFDFLRGKDQIPDIRNVDDLIAMTRPGAIDISDRARREPMGSQRDRSRVLDRRAQRSIYRALNMKSVISRAGGLGIDLDSLRHELHEEMMRAMQASLTNPKNAALSTKTKMLKANRIARRVMMDSLIKRGLFPSVEGGAVSGPPFLDPFFRGQGKMGRMDRFMGAIQADDSDKGDARRDFFLKDKVTATIGGRERTASPEKIKAIKNRIKELLTGDIDALQAEVYSMSGLSYKSLATKIVKVNEDIQEDVDKLAKAIIKMFFNMEREFDMTGDAVNVAGEAVEAEVTSDVADIIENIEDVGDVLEPVKDKLAEAQAAMKAVADKAQAEMVQNGVVIGEAIDGVGDAVEEVMHEVAVALEVVKTEVQATEAEVVAAVPAVVEAVDDVGGEFEQLALDLAGSSSVISGSLESASNDAVQAVPVTIRSVREAQDEFDSYIEAVARAVGVMAVNFDQGENAAEVALFNAQDELLFAFDRINMTPKQISDLMEMIAFVMQANVAKAEGAKAESVQDILAAYAYIEDAVSSIGDIPKELAIILEYAMGGLSVAAEGVEQEVRDAWAKIINSIENVGDEVENIANETIVASDAVDAASDLVTQEIVESTNTFVMAFRTIRDAISDSADGIRNMAAIVKARQLANQSTTASATASVGATAASGGRGGGSFVGGLLGGLFGGGGGGRGGSGPLSMIAGGLAGPFSMLFGVMTKLSSIVVGLISRFLNLLKIITLVGSAAIVFAPLVAGLVAVGVAVKNLFTAMSASGDLKDKLTASLKRLGSAAKSLIKPFVDGINAFFGFNTGAKDLAGSTSVLASILVTLMDRLSGFMESLSNSTGFQDFARSANSSMTQVLNIVINVGEAIVALLGGGTEAAAEKAKEAFMRLKYGLLGLVQTFIPMWKGMTNFFVVSAIRAAEKVAEIMVQLFGVAIPLLLEGLGAIFAGFWQGFIDQAKLAWEAAKSGKFDVVLDIFSPVVAAGGVLVGGALTFSGVGAAVGVPLLAAAAYVAVDALSDASEEFQAALAAEDLPEVVEKSYAALDGTEFGTEFGREIYEGLSSTLDSAFNDLSNSITEAREGIAADFQDMFGTDIESPAISFSLQESADIYKQADEIATAFAQALSAGGEDLADDIENAVRDAVSDALEQASQQFVDYVADYLASQVDKFKSQMLDQLQSQKADQLKIFDDQLAAIDALEKAEQDLFKQQQRIEEDRQRMRERALQRENYNRNRALAIYEGRIDDARMLDLEQKRVDADNAAEDQRITVDRAREEQQRQRDIVKEILKRQKEDAAAAFDDIIANFEETIAKIGEYGTYNQEELEAQLGEVLAAAQQSSIDLGDAFESYYLSIPDIIAEHTDATVGFFETPMDKLVQSAKDIFGITNPGAETVLGATAQMLTSMGDYFSNETTGLPGIMATADETFQGIVDNTITPTTEEIERILEEDFDPASIMEAAYADANTRILREYEKMIDSTASITAEVASNFDPLIEKLIAVEAAAKAAGDAVANSANTPPPSSGGGNGLPSFNINDEGRRQIADRASRYVESAFPNLVGGDAAIATLTSQITEAVIEIESYLRAANGVVQKQNVYDTLKGNYSGRVLSGVKSHMRTYHPQVTLAKGGMVPYGNGGMATYMAGGMAVPGFGSTGVPALLHGGEFVLNKAAVDRIGLSVKVLERLNKERFNDMTNDKFVSQLPYFPDMNNIKFGVPRPDYNKGGGIVNSYNTTNTTNIYVDNFIGEDEWFRKMLKDYNINHKRIDDRRYGITDPIYTTYKGASF